MRCVCVCVCEVTDKHEIRTGERERGTGVVEGRYVIVGMSEDR